VSDPGYDRSWVTFRRHVRFMRIAECLWYVPLAFALLAIVVPMMLHGAARGSPLAATIFFALLACAVIARIVADVRLKAFMCPRCHHPFVKLRILQRSPLTTIDRRVPCQHCQLPVYAVSG
jgi:hypothetical protein